MKRPAPALYTYLHSVLGIRTLLRSPAPSEPAQSESVQPMAEIQSTSSSESASTSAAATFQVFGPAQAPFGFVLPSAFLGQQDWHECLSDNDAQQFARMLAATGRSPQEILLVFVDEDQLEGLDRTALDLVFKKSSRWIVMGGSLVRLLWKNQAVQHARGQVLTVGTSYLWPSWGLWEMNANPQLKREVWNDMKRAFQGLMTAQPAAPR